MLDILDIIPSIFKAPFAIIALIWVSTEAFFKTDATYMTYVLGILSLSLFFLFFYTLFFLFRFNRKIKNNKKILGITLLIILLSLIITVYYYFLSTRIEPLIYLHNKYNIAYSDIKIIKTARYSEPFFGNLGDGNAPLTPRGATLIYKDLNTHKDVSIYVYYSEYKKGWTDEYVENIKIKNPPDESFYQ